MRRSGTAAPQDLASAHVFYEVRGADGPRMILLHPIGFDHESWTPVLPALDDSCILLPDLPGHGESDKPTRADYSLPSLARRVVQLLDEVGWQDACFVGNSIGGGVALAAALTAPERVTGLVLINSVGFRDGLPLVGRLRRLPLLPLVCSFAPSFAMKLGLGYPRGVRSSVSDELCSRCSRYLRASAGRGAFYETLKRLYGPALDEMSSRYSEIRQPTLVIHGTHDPLIRMLHARRLVESIPGARLLELPGCGHFPQEECPEQTASAIRSFLESSVESHKPDRAVAAPIPGRALEA